MTTMQLNCPAFTEESGRGHSTTLQMTPLSLATGSGRTLVVRNSRRELAGSVPVSVEVRRGAAHDQIVAAARDLKSDIIIIATHGRTGFNHVLLGSTAERVVRHAPCPVVTLRHAR